jgi:hypothetical protein
VKGCQNGTSHSRHRNLPMRRQSPVASSGFLLSRRWLNCCQIKSVHISDAGKLPGVWANGLSFVYFMFIFRLFLPTIRYGDTIFRINQQLGEWKPARWLDSGCYAITGRRAGAAQ